MLKDFSWDMTGYIPKHNMEPSANGLSEYLAERIFQLELAPPKVDSINEYILSALREKNMIYFSFFLHHYEPQLNKRIKSFLGLDSRDPYNTERFLDIKLSCREQMLQKLTDYDPDKGAEYATYIYPFIRDAMLLFRMGEEAWSVSSLSNYKLIRSMAWLYHNTKDAVSEFARKYHCDLALAEEYLKVARGIRNQQSFYVTDEDGEETGEDVALDDSWNYTDILWNGIQAEKVQRAFEKLNYREQTLLEKRLAICMTCGRGGSWKNRFTFEELAVMFEGSTSSGAERAYRNAVAHLTELLVAEGALHAVLLKQKSKIKRKKKIAAAVYEYQVDYDGEWGEIVFDFENSTAQIVRLADWDTVKTNRFAPFMYCYAAGMVGLEDIDNHTANALFVTPLGSAGYVISHFGIPAVLGVITTWLMYPFLHISDLSAGNVFFISIIWGLVGFVMALLMVTASRNKMEGLVITRIEAVSLMAYLVPFFMTSKLQYLFAWLPSWWIGKSMSTGNPVVYVLCTVVTALWAVILYRKFSKRILT